MSQSTSKILESSATTVHQWLKDSKAILIDVRETAEYEQEHIPGSMLVPLSCFEPELFPKFKVKRLVLHCAVGKRSAAAAKQLSRSGYPYDIINMQGGIRAWKADGLPTECLEDECEEAIKISAPHPGRVLSSDFLNPFGITQAKLAKDLSISIGRVNQIIGEKRSLSVDTALRLSRYFSTTAKFWLNLQMDYDVEYARINSGSDIDELIKPRRLRL